MCMLFLGRFGRCSCGISFIFCEENTLLEVAVIHRNEQTPRLNRPNRPSTVFLF